MFSSSSTQYIARKGSVNLHRLLGINLSNITIRALLFEAGVSMSPSKTEQSVKDKTCGGQLLKDTVFCFLVFGGNLQKQQKNVHSILRT